MTRPSWSPEATRYRRQVQAAGVGFWIVLAVALAPMTSARSTAWSLTRSPASVTQGQPTSIAFVATNTGDGSGGSVIGCIVLAVPPQFSVATASIDAKPAGKTWTAKEAPGPGGYTLVTLAAKDDGSRLKGGSGAEAVGFSVQATGLQSGVTDWIAVVYHKVQCSSDMNMTKDIQVTVTGAGPTPTPPPTPKPTPTPTPTPTPGPTPTPTPTAAPTPRPTPSPVPTATPLATSTPVSPELPTPTPLGSPDATPTTDPSPSGPTSTPSSSADPIATPEPQPGSSAAPGAGGTGGTGGDGGDPPPGAAFTIAASSSGGQGADAQTFGDDFAQFAAFFGRAFDWAVPGFALAGPGLLLILAIAAQTAGALAWLPIVRRRIGGFGFRTGPSDGSGKA